MQQEPQTQTQQAQHEYSPKQEQRTARQIEAERQESLVREAQRLQAKKEEEQRRLQAEKEEEKRRLLAEKEEEKKRLQAEQARLAREHQRLVETHYAYVRNSWPLFQKVQHDAPPSLLPLEGKQELKRFQEYLKLQSPRVLEPEAIDRFESEIDLVATAGEQAVRSIEAELKSTSFFDSIRKLTGFGNLIDLLRKCGVSISAPELGSPAKEAVAAARRFLRRSWSSHLDQDKQALFSVHRCAGKTVIHLGSSVFGSVFITLPQSLAPEALAEAFLAEIRRVTSKFIPQKGTLAVVDGDHQGINYQRVFESSIVVRSVSDDCERLEKNLNELLERELPEADNTALHLGLPANEDELGTVFKSGGADWDLWREIAPSWASRATRHGFDRPSSASSQQILKSLTTSKNVIIVVAHGDDRTIYLPAPPPEGSELSADQIIARKEEISANKPIVYLFCCETAEISNLKNFSQVLLDCGAAAVIAPQTKIDAERSVDFFEGIVNSKARSGNNSLTNVKGAERSSKYSEMEIWLG
jgi:hypothetical protein